MNYKWIVNIGVLVLMATEIFSQNTRKFSLETTNSLPDVYTSTGKVPEIVINECHSAYVNSAEYVANGKYIMSASKEEVKIWETASGNLIHTFKNIDFPYDNLYQWNCIAPEFSPDGKYFAYHSEKNNKIKIVTVLTDEERIIDSYKGSTEDAIDKIPDDGYISFSPTGEHIAVSKNNDISIYSTNNLNKEYTLKGSDVYKRIIFSYNGTYLIGATKTRIDIWDVEQKRIIESISNISLFDGNAIAISPNDRYIAFVVGEGISVYDMDQHKIIYSLETFSMVFDLEFRSSTTLYTVEHDWLDISYGCINEWNVSTGKKISSTEADDIAAMHISFSPNGEYMLSLANSGKMKCFSSESGKLTRIIGNANTDLSVAYVKQDDSLMLNENDKYFFILDKDFNIQYAGNIQNIFGKIKDYNSPMPAYWSNGKGIFGVSNKNGNYGALYYDFASKQSNNFGNFGETDYVRYLINEKANILYLYLSNPNELYAYNSTNGNELFTIKSSNREWHQKISISPNSKYVIIDCEQEATEANRYTRKVAEIFDSITGKKITTLSPESVDWKIHFDSYHLDLYGGHVSLESICRFSNDEKYCIFSYGDGLPAVYDTETWKPVYVCDETYAAYISNNGKYIACNKWDGKLSIYDWKANKKVFEYSLEENFLDFYFCSNDTKIATLSYGGILRIYDLKTGKLLASIIADSFGDYLTYTPEGYFTGSPGGINKFVHLVDGMQVFELGQMYDTLYRPDLVQAKLEGKDIGAPVLKDIVATGDAPRVQFVGTPMATSRQIKLEFSVQDTGGGVGYVYLSQNGKAMQVSAGEESKVGRRYIYTCEVTLAKGENLFEAYAANNANKIESRHVSVNLSWQGKVESANLYVLAMGVDKYAKMPKNNLKYSVADATAIIESFKTAPGGLYSSVNVMTLLDSDVNKANIEKAFETFAAKVKPDDMFVLHIAGHGVNYGGEYYFLPADTNAKSEADFASQGVSKHFLTENLSKIQALNTLVLLDTCYSGAFIDAKAQGNELAQKTALEHLAHTSGQVILTAAANSQTAGEGYEGHGIFTYAIMEALSGKANYNADSSLSIKEITQYIGYEIPNIYEKMGQARQSPWASPLRGDFSVVSAGNKASPRSFELSPDGQAQSASWFSVRVDDSAVAAYTEAYNAEKSTQKKSSAENSSQSVISPEVLLYGNLGIVAGDFYDGLNFQGEGYFFKLKYLHLGPSIEFIATGPDDDHKDSMEDDGFIFFDAMATARLAVPIGRFVPYICGGAGGYVCLIVRETKNKDLEDNLLAGFAWQCGVGLNFSLTERLSLGGFYKLKYFDGAGYIDNYGVSFGIGVKK